MESFPNDRAEKNMKPPSRTGISPNHKNDMFVLKFKTYVPGNSSGPLWDGEHVTFWKGCKRDLQRLGIKRSRLESPGSWMLIHPIFSEWSWVRLGKVLSARAG